MNPENLNSLSCSIGLKSQISPVTVPSSTTEETLDSSSVIFLPVFTNSQMTSVKETTLSAITTGLSMKQREALISASNKDALIAQSRMSSLIVENPKNALIAENPKSALIDDNGKDDNFIAQTMLSLSEGDSTLVDQQCSVEEDKPSIHEVEDQQTITEKLSEADDPIVTNISENESSSFIGKEISLDDNHPFVIEESEPTCLRQENVLVPQDDMANQYNMKPYVGEVSSTPQPVLIVGETLLPDKEQGNVLIVQDDIEDQRHLNQNVRNALLSKFIVNASLLPDKGQDDIEEEWHLKPNVRNALISKLRRSSSTTNEPVLPVIETVLSADDAIKNMPSVDNGNKDLPSVDDDNKNMSSVDDGNTMGMPVCNDKGTVETPDCDEPEDASFELPGSPGSIISISFSDANGDSLDMEVDEVVDGDPECGRGDTSDMESGQSGDVEAKSDDSEDKGITSMDVLEHSSVTSGENVEDMSVDQPESANEDISTLIESSVLSGQCLSDNPIAQSESNEHENIGETINIKEETDSEEENMDNKDDSVDDESENDTDTGDEIDSPNLKLSMFNTVETPTPVFLFANKNHNRNLIQARNSTKVLDVKYNGKAAKLISTPVPVSQNSSSTLKNQSHTVIVGSSPNTVTQTTFSSSSSSQKPQLIGNAIYSSTATSLLKNVIDNVKNPATTQSMSAIPAIDAGRNQSSTSTAENPTSVTSQPSSVNQALHPVSLSSPLVVQTSSNLSPTKKLIINDGRKVVVTTGYPIVKTVNPKTVTSGKSNFPPFRSKHLNQKSLNERQTPKPSMFDTTVKNIISHLQKCEKVNDISIKNVQYTEDAANSASQEVVSSRTINVVGTCSLTFSPSKYNPSTPNISLKPITSVYPDIELRESGLYAKDPNSVPKKRVKPVVNSQIEHAVSVANMILGVGLTNSSVQSSKTNMSILSGKPYAQTNTVTAALGNGTTQKLPTKMALKPDITKPVTSHQLKGTTLPTTMVSKPVMMTPVTSFQLMGTLNIPSNPRPAFVYMSGLKSSTTTPSYSLPSPVLSVKAATTLTTSTGNQTIHIPTGQNQMQRQASDSKNLTSTITKLLGSAPVSNSSSPHVMPKKIIKLPANYTVPNAGVRSFTIRTPAEPLGKLISILPTMQTVASSKETPPSAPEPISPGVTTVKLTTSVANPTNIPSYYFVRTPNSTYLSSSIALPTPLSTFKNTTTPVRFNILNTAGNIKTSSRSLVGKASSPSTTQINALGTEFLEKNQHLVKALSSPVKTYTVNEAAKASTITLCNNSLNVKNNSIQSKMSKEEHKSNGQNPNPLTFRNYNTSQFQSTQVVHVYPPSRSRNPSNKTNSYSTCTFKTVGVASTVVPSTQTKTISVPISSPNVPRVVEVTVSNPPTKPSLPTAAYAKTASEILKELAKSKSKSGPMLVQKDSEVKDPEVKAGLDIVIDSVFSLAHQYDAVTEKSIFYSEKDLKIKQYFDYRFHNTVSRSGAKRIDDDAMQDGGLRKPCFVVLENLKENCSKSSCSVVCRRNVVRKLCQRIVERSERRKKSRRKRIFTSRKRQQKKRGQDTVSPLKTVTPPVSKRSVNTKKPITNTKVTQNVIPANSATSLPRVNTNENQIVAEGNQGTQAVTDGKGNKFLMIKIDKKTILIPALNDVAHPKAYVLEGNQGTSLTEAINKIAKQQVTSNSSKANESSVVSTNTSLTVTRPSAIPSYSVAKTTTASTSVTKVKSEPITAGYEGDKDYTVTVKTEPEFGDCFGFAEMFDDQSDTTGPTPSKVPKTNTAPVVESAADRIKRLRNELKEREKALDSLRRKRVNEDDDIL